MALETPLRKFCGLSYLSPRPLVSIPMVLGLCFRLPRSAAMAGAQPQSVRHPPCAYSHNKSKFAVIFWNLAVLFVTLYPNI